MRHFHHDATHSQSQSQQKSSKCVRNLTKFVKICAILNCLKKRKKTPEKDKAQRRRKGHFFVSHMMLHNILKFAEFSQKFSKSKQF